MVEGHRRWVVLAIIAIAILGFIQLTRHDGPFGLGDDSPTTRSTPAFYLSEYGGQASVYAAIAALSNCDAVQLEFDTAEANFYREVNGGPSREPYRQAALGYMNAAADRGSELGC